MQPHASVLFIIVDQINRLGLSKTSVKSLVSKARKADTPEKKEAVILKLNALADSVWKRFLTLDVKAMTKLSAEDNTTYTMLSPKLFALYFFQVHTHGFSNSSLAEYISLGRRGKTEEAQRKLTEKANEIAREVYTRYIRKFPLSLKEHTSEKANVQKNPTKKRVVQVVEKIDELKESKKEDLESVKTTIRETEETPENVVTLAMLRERAKTLKVDISDLGRKKKEIIIRLREAEQAAGLQKAKKQVIPKAVEEDAALAPEPISTKPSEEFFSFSQKSFNTLKEKLSFIEEENFKSDVIQIIKQRVPRRVSIKLDFEFGNQQVNVIYPQGTDSATQKLIRDSLESLAGNVSSGYDGSIPFFGVSYNKIYHQYGKELDIKQTLDKLPSPNSVSDVLVGWENLSKTIGRLRNYLEVKTSAIGNDTADTNDLKLVDEWLENATKAVFGTTADQIGQKLKEMFEEIDASYEISAQIEMNTGLPIYRVLSNTIVLNKDALAIMAAVLNTDTKKAPNLAAALIAKHTNKKVQVDASPEKFKLAKKVESLVENIKIAIKNSIGEPASLLKLSTRDDEYIKISISRFGHQLDEDTYIYPHAEEINAVIRKTCTTQGFKIIEEGLVRKKESKALSREHLKTLDRLNQTRDVKFTEADIYQPRKEYLTIVQA
jgi:hypothetical protein